MIRGIFKGTSLELRGHAGSAPYGQDLVCAGVSALVYALAQRLTQLHGQGALKEPPKIHLESGKAIISATAKEAYEAEVREDFQLISSGMKLLEKHYPQQIEIQQKGTCL